MIWEVGGENSACPESPEIRSGRSRVAPDRKRDARFDATRNEAVSSRVSRTLEKSRREHMAYHRGGSWRTAVRKRRTTDRSTFVWNYGRNGRSVAFTLRFSRFRILCSITMMAWRNGSTVSVEACFSNLGLAEGILHGQQTRTGNRNGNQTKLNGVPSAGWRGASGTAEWRAERFRILETRMRGDVY